MACMAVMVRLCYEFVYGYSLFEVASETGRLGVEVRNGELDLEQDGSDTERRLVFDSVVA
jgi:hypothetical protein